MSHKFWGVYLVVPVGYLLGITKKKNRKKKEIGVGCDDTWGKACLWPPTLLYS